MYMEENKRMKKSARSATCSKLGLVDREERSRNTVLTVNGLLTSLPAFRRSAELVTERLPSLHPNLANLLPSFVSPAKAISRSLPLVN